MLRIVLCFCNMVFYGFGAIAEEARCADCERIERRATEITKTECAKLTGEEVKFCELDAEAIAIEAGLVGAEHDLQSVEENVVPGGPTPSPADRLKPLRKNISDFERTYGIRF